MTSLIVYGITQAFAMAAQLADCITTDTGLATGGKETNPVQAWIIKHTGMLGMYLGKVVLYPALGVAAATTIGYVGGAIVAATIGVEGAVCTIINYKRLKKANIKVL